MATMEELYQQYLLTQPGIGGSQNRYRELMSQARPFVNPYPAATGLLAGATATPPPRAPANNPLGTYSSGPGGSTINGVDQTLDTANPAWDALTDAQKSDFYAKNPGFSKATQIGQSIFTNFGLLGKAQALLDPERVNREGLIAQGFDFNAYQKARDDFRENELQYAREQDALAQQEAAQAQAETARQVAQESFRQSEINAMNQAAAQAAAQAQAVQDTAAVNVSSPTAVAMASMQNALNQDTVARNQAASLAAAIAIAEDRQAANESAQAQNNIDAGLAASTDAEDAARDAARAASISNSPGGGAFGGPGYDGGMFSGAQSGDVGFSKGGKVTKNRLKGPDPKGPDEGYGALLGGEFVLQKSAVKKYGAGLLGMINDGKIPVQKMKSLLG